jgi:hypothetical protein
MGFLIHVMATSEFGLARVLVVWVTISNCRLKFNRFGLDWLEAEAIRLRGFYEF